MKKVSLFFMLLLPVLMWASERSASEAAAVAAEFMNEQIAQSPQRKAACNASSFVLAHTRNKLHSEAPAFYVFNRTNKEGYVVVSADDRTEDVLVYSEQGQLDMDNINPNFAFWLHRLQEQISAANDENTYSSSEKKARKAAMATTAISPLLVNAAGKEIAWYQEEPYWNQCPMDLWKTRECCLTGCVATAAAQIMYKWRYPAKGTGSHSYTWECCTDLDCNTTSSKKMSKDFSTVTFDWDNMLATYHNAESGKLVGDSIQQNAVATLMSCCGIACDMQYGGETIGGSGAWTDDMGYGMIQYFGYKVDKFITTYTKKSYQSTKGASIADLECEWSVSTSQFTTYFNTELEAGRPILMGGEDGNSGHEFVCDGRDSNGKFHINWGWEGDSNCYCTLDALKTGDTREDYDFSDNIDALIGLQPAVVDTVFVTGVTVSPTQLTLKQKEKATLTASVSPANATVKTVTWSSSNNSIATVSATGQVTGVAEGSATITATTTDGQKKATCAVTVTNEVTECEPYSYEFTKKCSTGTNKLGDYSWNISLNAGEVQVIDQQNGRGQQFGSKNTPCKQVSLVTSDVTECECLLASVTVNAAMGSDGDGQLAVYIGKTQIGTTQKLTSSATDYTFDNPKKLEGDVEIRLTNTKKALYVKSINLTMASHPTDLISQRTDSPINQRTKVILDGQLYIISGGRMYNAQGQLVR